MRLEIQLKSAGCGMRSCCDLWQASINGLLAENPGVLWGVVANTTVYMLGIRVLLAGLTWGGVVHSWILGCTTYAAFGLGGYFLVCLYFLLGSWVCAGSANAAQNHIINE